MKKFCGAVFVFVVIIFLGVTSLNVDAGKIFALPDNIIVSNSDIKFLNNDATFGKFITANLSDITASSTEKNTAKMWLKLFGIIPIKQVQVEFSKGEEVYVGGLPLGFAIKSNGLLVVGSNSVGSEVKERVVQNGDIITKINGQKVVLASDVANILNQTDEKSFTLTIDRNGQELTYNLTTEVDENGEEKLGLWVKNDASGVGTLTFVKISNKHFGALGHAITDFETGAIIPCYSGKIYKCNQVGISKAEKSAPGELRCVFLQGINQKGSIEKNTRFGVFGEVTDVPSLVDFNRTAEIGSRLTVKTGPAKIVSSVSGVREEYDIEIIKTAYQPESDDKSFIFRVTDKRLLALTGGIVQGMSGSPILQNGKLIGAITHVFVSEPTRGYGIYADFMINN